MIICQDNKLYYLFYFIVITINIYFLLIRKNTPIDFITNISKFCHVAKFSSERTSMNIVDLKALQSAKTFKKGEATPQKKEAKRKKAVSRVSLLSDDMDNRKAVGDILSPTKILSYCTIMCESRNLSIDFPSTVKNLAVLKAYFKREDYIASGLADSFSEYITYLVDYWEFFCISKHNKWMRLFPDVLPLFQIIWYNDLRNAFHAFIKERKNRSMKDLTAIQSFRENMIIKIFED